MRYWKQYQDARIKLDQKRRALDKLKKGAMEAGNPDGILETQGKIEAAQAEYDAAKEEADDLWYLSNTGQHKPEATAPVVRYDMLGFSAFQRRQENRTGKG